MFKNFEVIVDTAQKSKLSNISVNSNDLNTLKLSITINQFDKPIDLTGATVRIAIVKPDNKTVFQDCTITDPTIGICEVVLETQAFIIAGVYIAEVMIYYGTDKIAVTGRFSYSVSKGILDNSTVESTNDWQAINQAIANAEEILIDLRENGTGIDAQARSELKTVTTQLEDKSNLTNEKVFVLNERTGVVSAIDVANFAGQGLPRTEAPIGYVFHHYTDGEMMRLDNVGDSPILTLKNARNDLRRNDKPAGYVGKGNFLECREQHDTGTYNLFTVGSDGDLRWFDNGKSSKVKLYNLKTPVANEYAFELIPYNANTKLLNLMSANNLPALLISIDSSNYLQFTTTSNQVGMKFNPTGNFLVSPINGSIILQGDTFVRKDSISRKVQTIRSGTTANRPTADYLVGEEYYDTTLGKPIWLHSTSPYVWHDAMGTTV